MSIMVHTTKFYRAGMTLVELLVVVAILGLLSVVVLPNLSRQERGRGGRLASASTASHFATAQSAAIARRRTHGVWLEPLQTGSNECIDLYSAEVPDAYRGDDYRASFEVAPHTSNSVTLVESPASCAASLGSAAFGDFASPGNLIQFNESGPFFDFRWSSGTPPGTPWRAYLRPSVGQTSINTIWPASPPATHRFAIHRIPTRVGRPLTLGEGMAIDVTWSGMATQRFGTSVLDGDGVATTANLNDDWTMNADYVAACGVGPSAKPAIVVPLFDPSGALAELCFIAKAPGAATARLAVNGPLYFLVGRVDRCGLPHKLIPTEEDPGANWQYADSRWIAVDPKTGLVKTAEVVPNATTARDSQALIRAGLVGGGP